MLCDPAYGIGSDGVLFDFGLTSHKTQHVRIFNPDGSEAESSGNGLRIFATYLFEQTPQTTPLSIETLTKRHTAQVVHDKILVSMGPAKVGAQIEYLQSADYGVVEFMTVDMGNPHCVVLNQPVNAMVAKQLGSEIETNQRFPNRTNVQLLNVIDKTTIQIEIWERGAGYTNSSGSSSCAAAAVSYLLKKTDKYINVITKGGILEVDFSKPNNTFLTGPVTKICTGEVLLSLPS